VELAPNAGTWNNVAYELAVGRAELDRAQRYAESAVATIVAAARLVDVDHANAAALATTRSLASYWDTLGWVAFAKRDLVTAEKYVRAAWTVAQYAEVGDHLGQILEELNHDDEAATAYARALNASRPDRDIRRRLADVAGGANVDPLIAKHKADLAAARTVALGRGPSGKQADFFVAFAPPGRVDGVRFIAGDAEMRDLSAQILTLRVDGMFPDDQPARLLRRMTVTCGGDGRCSGVLVLPADAKPAK